MRHTKTRRQKKKKKKKKKKMKIENEPVGRRVCVVFPALAR
jgi:hypothetical protein